MSTNQKTAWNFGTFIFQMEKGKEQFSTHFSSQCEKILTGTTVEEIKLVVRKKHEFDLKRFPKTIAFQYYRTIKIHTLGTKSIVFE